MFNDQSIIRTGQEMLPGIRFGFSGVDPDWTKLAMLYGFQPSSFPAVGTEGQEEQNYLIAMKQAMDEMLGGPGGNAARISPNNPINGTPFNLRMLLSGMAAMYNSLPGRSLLPTGYNDQLNSGYQFGGITPGESLFQKGFRIARGGAQGAPGVEVSPSQSPALPSGDISAKSEVPGEETSVTPQPGPSPALPTPSASPSGPRSIPTPSSVAADVLGTHDPNSAREIGNRLLGTQSTTSAAAAPAPGPMIDYISAGINSGILPRWMMDIVTGMGASAARAIEEGQARR